MPASPTLGCGPRARIALTASAEILDWGDGQVLKLFHDGWPAAAATREARAATLAHDVGVLTPRVIETVIVDRRPGIVFERKDGPDLLLRLMRTPGDAALIAGSLGTVHAAIHGHPGAGLAQQRERLHDAIVRASGLDARTMAGILARLRALPDGTALCHGDLHPSQIIEHGGAPVVIDWFDASCGDPAADVAKTLLVMRHASLAGVAAGPALTSLERLRDSVCAHYLDAYRNHRAMDDERVNNWLPVVAAARLATAASGAERDALLDIIHRACSAARHSPGNAP